MPKSIDLPFVLFEYASTFVPFPVFGKLLVAQDLGQYPHDEKFNPIDDWVTIRVDLPEIAKTVRYVHPTETKARSVKTHGAYLAAAPWYPVITGLPIKRDGNHVYPIWAWPGSVADELREISVKLANTRDRPESTIAPAGGRGTRKLGGSSSLAKPRKCALRTRDGNQRGAAIYLSPNGGYSSQIPWLPEKGVLRAYRLMWRQTLGGKNVPKRTTTLEVARFVRGKRGGG